VSRRRYSKEILFDLPLNGKKLCCSAHQFELEDVSPVSIGFYEPVAIYGSELEERVDLVQWYELCEYNPNVEIGTCGFNRLPLHQPQAVIGSRSEQIDSEQIIIGRISWDLTCVRLSPGWFGGQREQVGLFPWEQMSWLVYMPAEWILTTVTWNWAQNFEPGLILALGDFRNKEVGELSVDFQGCRTVFEKSEYRLLHTRWNYDATTTSGFRQGHGSTRKTRKGSCSPAWTRSIRSRCFLRRTFPFF
jgi:hypothetical protein